MTGFEVNSKGRKNELYTFWDQNDVNLSRGIDFTPRGNVFARINHLQHQNFSYRITVIEKCVLKHLVRLFCISKRKIFMVFFPPTD